jgi:hypothetical protein
VAVEWIATDRPVDNGESIILLLLRCSLHVYLRCRQQPVIELLEIWYESILFGNAGLVLDLNKESSLDTLQ